jgi:hypothetical protein
MLNKVYPATMRDGSEYTGIQQFAGSGIVKWCAICGTHRTQLGGTIRHVLGGRHWVCSKHPKAGAKNA